MPWGFSNGTLCKISEEAANKKGFFFNEKGELINPVRALSEDPDAFFSSDLVEPMENEDSGTFLNLDQAKLAENHGTAALCTPTQADPMENDPADQKYHAELEQIQVGMQWISVSQICKPKKRVVPTIPSVETEYKHVSYWPFLSNRLLYEHTAEDLTSYANEYFEVEKNRAMHEMGMSSEQAEEYVNSGFARPASFTIVNASAKSLPKHVDKLVVYGHNGSTEDELQESNSSHIPGEAVNFEILAKNLELQGVGSIESLELASCDPEGWGQDRLILLSDAMGAQEITCANVSGTGFECTLGPLETIKITEMALDSHNNTETGISETYSTVRRCWEV